MEDEVAVQDDYSSNLQMPGLQVADQICHLSSLISTQHPDKCSDCIMEVDEDEAHENIIDMDDHKMMDQPNDENIKDDPQEEPHENPTADIIDIEIFRECDMTDSTHETKTQVPSLIQSEVSSKDVWYMHFASCKYNLDGLVN